MEYYRNIMSFDSTGKKYHFPMPNICPVCGTKMKADSKLAYNSSTYRLIDFTCTHDPCRMHYMGFYLTEKADANNVYLKYLYCYPTERSPEISNRISVVSERFVEWFKQARRAESAGDMLVAVSGYRCALEVLIKDYAKEFRNVDPNSLRKLYLGQCVSTYLDGLDTFVAGYWANQYANNEMHYPPESENEFDFVEFKGLVQIVINRVDEKIKIAILAKQIPEKFHSLLDSQA